MRELVLVKPRFALIRNQEKIEEEKPFDKIRSPKTLTLAGRQINLLSCFDFSGVRSIYLDQESLKDFIDFGVHLKSLTTLDLRGISEKSSLSDVLSFLPANHELEKLNITSQYLSK